MGGGPEWSGGSLPSVVQTTRTKSPAPPKTITSEQSALADREAASARPRSRTVQRDVIAVFSWQEALAQNPGRRELPQGTLRPASLNAARSRAGICGGLPRAGAELVELP